MIFLLAFLVVIVLVVFVVQTNQNAEIIMTLREIRDAIREADTTIIE